MTNLNTIINNANIDIDNLMQVLHEMPWADIRSMAKQMGVSLTLKKGESRRIVEGRIADAIIATTAAVNTTETAATVETETAATVETTTVNETTATTETATVNETVTTAETTETVTTETTANPLTDSVKKGVLIAWGDATFIEKDGSFVTRGKGDGYALFFRATAGTYKGTVISLKDKMVKASIKGICEGLNKKGLSDSVVDKYVRRAVQIMVDNKYCHVCQTRKDWYVHMDNQELKKFWEDYKEVKTSK